NYAARWLLLLNKYSFQTTTPRLSRYWPHPNSSAHTHPHPQLIPLLLQQRTSDECLPRTIRVPSGSHLPSPLPHRPPPPAHRSVQELHWLRHIASPSCCSKQSLPTFSYPLLLFMIN